MKNFPWIGILTLIFIVLKLTGLIDWSWVWVLSPLWILALVALVGGLIIGFIQGWFGG